MRPRRGEPVPAHMLAQFAAWEADYTPPTPTADDWQLKTLGRASVGLLVKRGLDDQQPGRVVAVYRLRAEDMVAVLEDGSEISGPPGRPLYIATRKETSHA